MAAVDPVDVQLHLVHDCLRACVYADHIARRGRPETAWLSLSDVLYAEAVICWNGLFGSYGQPSHWTQLTERLPVLDESNLRPFSAEIITEHLEVSTAEWGQYHRAMMDARNDWLAHFNWKAGVISPPSLSWAFQSACLYRTWILSLLQEYRAQGVDIEITETTSRDVADQFRGQIAEIC